MPKGDIWCTGETGIIAPQRSTTGMKFYVVANNVHKVFSKHHSKRILL